MSEIAVPDPDNLLLTRLSLSSPAIVNASQWTGKRKVVGLPGLERWTGAAAIEPITTEIEERQWRAFLFGLRGPTNWFRWVLPCNSHVGSKPKVASGAGLGYELPLKGMATSQTILRAGQYITVVLPSGYPRTVCLTANLVSNSSGGGTAKFVPALGEVPAENTTVESLDPFIAMSPVEDVQSFSTTDGISSTSFEVEEAR